MRLSHLLTFEQAVARLDIDESGLDALIESGVLSTQPWLGDIYLLADEVSARASSSLAAPKPTPQVAA